jgi:anthranilate synthase component 1
VNSTRSSETIIEPVVHEVVLDADQPVAALAKLARPPMSFLLESAVGGERWARYTFLGTEPREAWRYRGGRAEQWTAETGWTVSGPAPNPMEHVGALLRSRRPLPSGGLPRFWGGAVGFLGYDVARALERLPHAPPDDTALPDGLLLITSGLVILDNLLGRARLVMSAEFPADAGGREKDAARRSARERIEEWLARLSGPGGLTPLSMDDTLPAASGSSAYSRAAFEAHVLKAKEHIARGDIFQVVLSRRTDIAGRVDPLLLYRYLRALNPAPYLYYLTLDGMALVGSSPEVLVRVEGGEVTVRPIAGTRPRGGEPDADAALAAELLADAKERAEHLMLLDLGRNDVGRVARFGSVEVTELMGIERYSHVQHLVSEVRGRLRDGCDPIDALKACFPAGTVTGAPKIRAMEIIDSLEPVRRGPYAGAVGYLGWGGLNLDTAIGIRTCVILKDRVLVQAGAGIVADSDPAREFEETEAKSEALRRAVALALRGSPES